MMRPAWVAIGLLVFGIALRALLAFPTGAFPGDADHILTGLTALRILGGDAAVFYAGDRHGAIESYLQIPAIVTLGATRTALATAPLLALAFALFSFRRLAVQLEGESRANVSLLFAVFAPATLMHWTVIPNGYAVTLALGTATLWLAAECVERESPVWFLAFGVVGGLAMWNSPLSIAPVLAAGVFLLMHVRKLTRFALAAVGFVAGFSPWILYNVAYDFLSLRSPYTAVSWDSLGSNTWKLIVSSLPGLLLHRDATWTKSNTPAAIIGAVLAILMIAGVSWIVRDARRYFLPLATAAACMAMFIASFAATIPENSRYLLFVTPLAAFALARVVVGLSRFHRMLGVAVAALWIAFNVVGYPLPQSKSRVARVALLDTKQQLVRQLRARGIRTVSGLYWDVYPLWFDSARTIVPVAYPLDADYHHQRTSNSRIPWAAVLSEPSKPFMVPALQHFGISGRSEVVGDWNVFVPDAPFAADGTLPLEVADEAERLWRASLVPR